MIIRLFRARIRHGEEEEFERFVIETGLPLVTAAEGCTHAAAGRSRSSEQPEFVVVTQWRSIDALRAFAGPDWPRAVIEPEEEHMLEHVSCDHFDLIGSSYSPSAFATARVRAHPPSR